MKKILATILALVLALGLTATVWAEGDGTASGNMTGADFLAKAKDGVITLTNNVSLSTSCSISDGQTYTINLNEHTLSADNTTIMLRHGKLIVNGTGTIKENSPYFGAILVKGSENSADENYSVVEVNAGVTLEGWSAIFVDQNAAKAYGVSVTVNGAVLNGVTDNEGGIGNGLYVNGSITHTENAPEISLKNTTITATGEGMYLAGYTTTTLTNCNITGMTGVEIRAGKLTVSGGAITGTATPVTVTPNGNGSTTAGAGVALAQHTTKLPVIVTIENATVKGYTGVYESNPQNNDPASIEKVNLTISGGNFEAINNGTNAVYSEDCTNFISGGTFSNGVDPTYLVDGLNYEVHTNAGYVYYSDFDTAAAAAAADGHEVIKVGTDDEGDVPFHIDYADGTGVKPALRMSKDNFELPTPTRSGYTFKGWKVLDCEGTQVLFAGPLSSEEVKSKIFAETAAGDGGAEVRVDYSDGVTLIAVWSSNSYYYYPSTSDTTTSTTTKGSPKTFDAGVGIYAVTAVLSVTGMAWTAKKRH